MANRNEIEQKVVKCFMRQLKETGLVNLFYSGSDTASKIFQMFKSAGNKRQTTKIGGQAPDSPFKKCRTIDEIVSTIHNLNDHVCRCGGIEQPEQLISMSLNHLIHFFLEHEFMKDGQQLGMDKINRFGQEVFNNCVASLFGCEMVDVYNNKLTPEASMEELRKQLWNIYMEGVANGNIQVSFEVFVNEQIAKMTAGNQLLSAMGHSGTDMAPQCDMYPTYNGDESAYDDEHWYLDEDDEWEE